MMRSTPVLLAGLALILAILGAIILVPLWLPVAMLAVAFLVREGAIKL
jgi:hypothetical protein